MAEHYLESLAFKDLVWQALSGLGEDLRAAVMLRYFSSNRSYEEIALILGVPVGTVRSRLATAKDQLLRHLQAERPARSEAPATTAFTVTTLGDIWRSLWQGDARSFDFFDADLRFTFVSPGAPPCSHSGIASWKDEVRGDVLADTVVHPDRVIVSHTVSIIEGRIENAPETPARCPPGAIAVLFHSTHRITRMRIHMEPCPAGTGDRPARSSPA
ncbi:MAG: sigma factor-like helix-turn-helix DNA-binding protein [Armatimonadota bacterium]|nr:sigma factor-like helix-turn-helix DNA-binding protein [Armatimonadota bacterium]